MVAPPGMLSTCSWVLSMTSVLSLKSGSTQVAFTTIGGSIPPNCGPPTNLQISGAPGAEGFSCALSNGPCDANSLNMGSMALTEPAVDVASFCCVVAGWQSAATKPRTKMKIAIVAAG